MKAFCGYVNGDWVEALLPEHPWVPVTFLGPQEAPSSLPLLPARSPHSQLTPLAPSLLQGPRDALGARGASWGVRGSELQAS